MNLKSIRWRLPLSYIVIALVAALASGVMMLTVLRSYYQQAERDYLSRNTSGIALAAQQLIQAGVPNQLLADQVNTWSFLLQARVQVYATDGGLLADSGSPDVRQVMVVASGAFNGPQFDITIPEGAAPLPPSTTLKAETDLSSGIFLMSSNPATTANQVIVVNNCLPGEPCSTGAIGGEIISGTSTITQPVGVILPLVSSFYGLEMNLDPEASSTHRSTQKVEQNLQDENGTLLGRIIVSEGPAYGSEIVSSVARAWALASLIALVVASVVGLLASRRITTPVLRLTNVTAQMAQGDLSARSGTYPNDEFGILGRSFDQMAEQIENLVGTLRRFVADAAHELNTPITVLQTDLELARTTTDAVERTHLLNQLAEQIERLHILISSLLDLSRLEGKADLRTHETVDLTSLVSMMSELYASRAEQAGLNFYLEMPDETITVTGDLAQLQSALENLLDNALKFTPTDGTVRLCLQKHEKQVVLVVEDTGIGIPEEDLPLLFKRFHRGRNAAAYPGNGLGLAIVDQIARIHGGYVRAEALHPGMRFTLQLQD